MARKTTISREGLEFLIGSVKNTINIGDIINNEDLADNKTYSNIKIEERIDDKIDEKLANFAGGGSIDLTEINTKMAQLETQVNDLFQSVSDGKTLVANAITDEGVSTSTTATFATMATNISKITTYKEETKSYNNTSTGTTRLVFTFSADVSGVKQITPPSDISSYIVPETFTSIFTIKGKELILYVNGNGTWKVTAFIKQ